MEKTEDLWSIISARSSIKFGDKKIVAQMLIETTLFFTVLKGTDFVSTEELDESYFVGCVILKVKIAFTSVLLI
ncbi:hypothetical protein J6590_094789 [Homalodisca vitripennis]|nr:hypothetical protein J6590_094789 [Homalodisca vitripennis]